MLHLNGFPRSNYRTRNPMFWWYWLNTLRKNCVLYLPMIYTTPNNTHVLDASKENNNGEIHGCVAAKAPWNRALSFDGENDYINCGNDPSLNITDAITIEAWVKRSGDSGVQDGIADKNAMSNGYLMRVSSNRVKFFMRHLDASPNYKMIQANDLLSDGTWTHCVAIRDSNYDMWLYINGVLQTDTANFPYSLDPSAGDLIIGKYGSTYLNGEIDEVRVYNRALSAGEIKKIYEWTKSAYKGF